MSKLVTKGSLCKCTFGTVPSILNVTTNQFSKIQDMQIATILDYNPVANIPSFGLCSSPQNPQVIAALGAPQPCIPVTLVPWSPGSSKVKLEEVNALTEACKATCAYGGVISISNNIQQVCKLK